MLKKVRKKKTRMSTFWQNFDIWAELAFGIHFGLFFELHRGGIMKIKGPETRFFDIWALFELSSLFLPDFDKRELN